MLPLAASDQDSEFLRKAYAVNSNHPTLLVNKQGGSVLALLNRVLRMLAQRRSSLHSERAMAVEAELGLSAIEAAAQRLHGVVRRTPLLESHVLSQISSGEVWLKAEVLQRTGSFKLRGATNMIAVLAEQGSTGGVIAASAGNHAQGVAVAAKALNRPCTIVMPEWATIAKVAATRSYGADIILHGHDYSEAQAEAERLAGERGLTLIPAYDHPLIVAGQGTVGLEILEDMPEVEVVVVPVGGGGLAAGVALAVKSRRPLAHIIGVQAEAAPGAIASLRAGRLQPVTPAATIADGIAVPAPGEVTFPLLQRYLDDIIAVAEETISQAMTLLLERSKLVVEGAGAVGVAALLAGKIDVHGKKVCSILSGGNVDINLLARVVEHGLSAAGRYLTLRVLLDDRPGRLAHVLTSIARTGANVLDIDQSRPGVDVPLGKAEVQLLLELRNPAHANEVAAALASAGYREQRRPPGLTRVFVPKTR